MDQAIVILLRIFLVSGFASITLWIVTYSMVARWWRNPVGRAIVLFGALVAALLVPTTLSLFFHLGRATSLAAAWADVALIGSVTPVMCWRIVTWRRLARYDQQRPGRDGAGPGERPV